MSHKFNICFSSVPQLWVHLSSPLTSPLVLQPTASVGTAQPIRTVAIVVEEGDREEPGGSEKLSLEGRRQDEEGEVLVQEAEELDDQLEVLWSRFETG